MYAHDLFHRLWVAEDEIAKTEVALNLIAQVHVNLLGILVDEVRATFPGKLLFLRLKESGDLISALICSVNRTLKFLFELFYILFSCCQRDIAGSIFLGIVLNRFLQSLELLGLCLFELVKLLDENDAKEISHRC